MRPYHPKPIKPLGKGASVSQECAHFIHEIANRLMILNLRGEIRMRERKERLALRHLTD